MSLIVRTNNIMLYRLKYISNLIYILFGSLSVWNEVGAMESYPPYETHTQKNILKQKITSFGSKSINVSLVICC